MRWADGAEGAGTKRAPAHLADEGPMGGVEGADGRPRKAGFDRRLSAARPPGLSRDPQVARVAALKLCDDRRPDVEPPGQDLRGRAAERAGTVGEIDACLTIQVQGA